VFANMPTLYGLVTLRFRLSEDKRRLDIQFQPKWHHVVPRVVLYTSALPCITYIVMNGKHYERKEKIAL